MQAFKSSGPFSCLLRDLRLCDPKGFDSSIVRVYFSKSLRLRASPVILSTCDAALFFGDPVCSCSVIKLDLAKNYWLVLISVTLYGRKNPPQTPADAGPVSQPAGLTIHPGTAVSDLPGILRMQGSCQNPWIGPDSSQCCPRRGWGAPSWLPSQLWTAVGLLLCG